MGTDGRTSIWTTWIARISLKTLAEACQKPGWQVHAYCLRSNHHHLVVEAPNANLAAELFADYSFDLSLKVLLFRLN